jgi:hypothetical protein
VQRATNPGNVALVMAKKFPEGARRNCFGHITKAQSLAKNEEHD